MGEVYRARDTRLGRDVAIKVLNASPDPDRLGRFEREARATALLAHPNILTIFDVGVHEGAPFLVCELLEGHTLRERLAGEPMRSKEAIGIGLQLSRGVAAAHALHVVHRDLKPENLFLTRDGTLKILDFGLAKLRAESSRWEPYSTRC
jgi:serine/threonine protein kinase